MQRFEATHASVRRVDRALIVTPTHENGSEIEEDMQTAGVIAMKFPARSTEGKFPNCLSQLADISEKLGLSVIAAVCPSCGNRAECLKTGYLGQLDAVKHAAVAIATHQRAVFQGIGGLAEGRGEFIAKYFDGSDNWHGTGGVPVVTIIPPLRLRSQILFRPVKL